MLEALLAVPAVIKVLVALGVIMAVNAWRRNLTLAGCAGVLVLALWCAHPLLPRSGASEGILRIALFRLVAADNLLMCIALMQVLWLTAVMDAGGAMRDLVATVRRRLGRRSSMAVLPAVIGWLPMPGGASMSAPLVGACDPEEHVDGMLKAEVNYWFRHIWEYWWPLYPGVLLAITITGLEAWIFMLAMVPVCLFSVAVGTVFLLRRVPPAPTDASPVVAPENHRPWAPFAPILTAVAVYGVIAGLWRDLPPAWKGLPLVIGLALGLALITRLYRIGRPVWWRILRNRKIWGNLWMVLAFQVFGAFVTARLPGGETLAGVMRGELAHWGIPALAMIMILPFLLGLVTGIAVAFVGGSFPIVMELIGRQADLAHLLPLVVLAYGSAYMGLLLSPVHICLIQTHEHFGTRLQRSLVRLSLPCAVLLALIAAYTAALRSGL